MYVSYYMTLITLLYLIGYYQSSQEELNSVWVVGSSLVKNAFVEARQSYGGCSLCLKRNNFRVWWQGKGACHGENWFQELHCYFSMNHHQKYS